MNIYDRLSNVSPRSLLRLDRAVYQVFGERLFSDEELRSLQKSTAANRKARVKTKLQLKYSDPNKLYRVHRVLLFNKIRTAVLILIGIAVLGLSAAYLAFMQLPRAYTIGHDIRLDPTGGSALSLRTLNLYVPKTNAGTEQAVESMLYQGPMGAKVILASDEFIPWLLRRSDAYTTDSANITTDATTRDAYRAFFSEFIALTDSTQASSVRYLDIPARKAIYTYLLTKDEYAGAVLATLSGQVNNFKRNCSISGVPISNTCLWPFFIEYRDNGEIRYFISLRKDGTRSNIVISQVGNELQTLGFKYRSTDGGVLDEKREIIWLAPSCLCLPNVPQYFVDPNLFVVWDGDTTTYVQAKIQQ
jgi:hypothetical protein